MSTKWAGLDFCCGTLMKQEISSTGVVAPDRKRYLTVEEYKRVGSFPDTYTLTGSRKDMIARIGNSVPPLMAEAVGRHIRNEIINRYAQTFGVSPYLSS